MRKGRKPTAGRFLKHVPVVLYGRWIPNPKQALTRALPSALPVYSPAYSLTTPWFEQTEVRLSKRTQDHSQPPAGILSTYELGRTGKLLPGTSVL